MLSTYNIKTVKRFFLLKLLSFLLGRRYRIEVRGRETIKHTSFPKKGGILFLANHPAEIDPAILVHTLWPTFRFHPIAVDFLFQQPFLRPFLDTIGALSVPHFEDFTNSYKLKQIEKTYDTIKELLNKGENILLYPGAGVKHQAEEIIGGTSGVHKILQECKDANVVLIRTTGLWGSCFSAAFTGRGPGFVKQFLKNIPVVLKNLIFFVPKREVLIECEAPLDFPSTGTRLQINRYLEQWYNQNGPEPLKLVSYAFWKKEIPPLPQKQSVEKVDFEKLSPEIKKKVEEEVSHLSHGPKEGLTGNEDLAIDLGLDSLDQAQLVIFLKETFGITGVHSSDLLTVNDVFAFAGGLKKSKEREEEEKPFAKWLEEKKRESPLIPQGETLLEAFFQSAAKRGSSLAAIDATTGEVSYLKMKQGVILFAKALKALPGKNIGIMMPASIAVNVVILATLLAGKVPVMINWTLGPRNLKVVMEESQIHHTVSSWRFLDRLENCDLNGLDNTFVLLEEIKRGFTLSDKLQAARLAKKSPRAILKHFGQGHLKGEDTAVILFTSGTENVPKGVPLTHHNILSNLRGATELVSFKHDDILLGVLPPFHSFGFSVTGLFPLLIGIKVAFLPNPMDGRRMAQGVEKWKVSIICIAPTFLKNLVRVATPQQLESLRLVVAGAEKMPEDLRKKLKEITPQVSVIEGYGITECAPVLTINPPFQKQRGVGKALPGVELLVVDPENRQELPVGKVGLVLARGPNVFHGYLNTRVSSPFVEKGGKQWYVTGDLGSVDEDHYLTLEGRLKRFTKVGGEMISLGAIEEILLEAASERGWKGKDDVPPLAVAVKEGDEGKKPEICLFTTFPLTLEEANQLLRKGGLSNLIRLTMVKELPFIPLLGTGKVDYRTLTAKISTV